MLKIQKVLDTSDLMDEVEIALCYAQLRQETSRLEVLSQIWDLLDSLPSENLEAQVNFSNWKG